MYTYTYVCKWEDCISKQPFLSCCHIHTRCICIHKAENHSCKKTSPLNQWSRSNIVDKNIHSLVRLVGCTLEGKLQCIDMHKLQQLSQQTEKSAWLFPSGNVSALFVILSVCKDSHATVQPLTLPLGSTYLYHNKPLLSGHCCSKYSFVYVPSWAGACSW